MGSIKKLIEFLKDKFINMTDEAKRRLVFICTGGFVFILILSVIFSQRSPGTEKHVEQPQRSSLRIAIPADEIFYPDEPDFIPGVILERQQRLAWTEENAAEYWQDPLREGEESWRQKIEIFIDEFLERIP